MNNEETKIDQVDATKLKRMQAKIYFIERNNMMTNEKTDSQMIEAIRKIIEEEAKKCY